MIVKDLIEELKRMDQNSDMRIQISKWELGPHGRGFKEIKRFTNIERVKQGGRYHSDTTIETWE